jgi:hypothetical protein
MNPVCEAVAPDASTANVKTDTRKRIRTPGVSLVLLPVSIARSHAHERRRRGHPIVNVDAQQLCLGKAAGASVSKQARGDDLAARLDRRVVGDVAARIPSTTRLRLEPWPATPGVSAAGATMTAATAAHRMM